MLKLRMFYKKDDFIVVLKKVFGLLIKHIKIIKKTCLLSEARKISFRR